MNEKSGKNRLSASTDKYLTLRYIALLVLSLSACAPSYPKASIPISKYICENAEHYASQVVGDGHCVSLIKLCSKAPDTIYWRPGKQVMSFIPNSLASGTIIATFRNNHYPSKTGYHAAIYISHDHRGIWVWDQWIGKPVHQRLVRTRYDGADANNTAQAYRIVK